MHRFCVLLLLAAALMAAAIPSRLTDGESHVPMDVDVDPVDASIGFLPAELISEISQRAQSTADFANFMRANKAIKGALERDSKSVVPVLRRMHGQTAFIEAARRGITSLPVLQALVPQNFVQAMEEAHFAAAHAVLAASHRAFSADASERVQTASTAIASQLTNSANINREAKVAEFARLLVKIGEKVKSFRAAIDWMDSRRNKAVTLVGALLRAAHQNDDALIRSIAKIPGIDLNCVSVQGWTPLTLASAIGNLNAVKALVTAGASVHRADGFMRQVNGQAHLNGIIFSTPLTHAARTNQIAVAEFLINHGARMDLFRDNPDSANWQGGFEPLQTALAEQHVEMLKFLSRHVDEKRTFATVMLSRDMVLERPDLLAAVVQGKGVESQQFVNFLNVFIRYRDVLLIRQLLDLGVSVTALGSQGVAPLAKFLSIVVTWPLTPEDAEIYNDVMSRDPNLNVPVGPNGVTALMVATCHAPVELLQDLIGRGADVAALDAHGNNALSHAIMTKRWATVRFLIDEVNAPLRPTVFVPQSAVDPNLTGYEFGALAALAFSDDLSLLQSAMERGLDVNTASVNGFNALIVAGLRRNVPMTRFLVDHGAEIWSLPFGSGPPGAVNPPATIQCAPGTFVTQLKVSTTPANVISNIGVICSDGLSYVSDPTDAYTSLPHAPNGITHIMVGTSEDGALSLLGYNQVAAGSKAPNAAQGYPELVADLFELRHLIEGSLKTAFSNRIMSSSGYEKRSGCPVIGVRLWRFQECSKIQFHFAC